MNMKEISGGICAAKGFKAAGIHCGIRKNRAKKDLALIVADTRCAAAGVYTTNKVYGAPIKVDRAHLADGYAQAIVCNSGIANTCAPGGLEMAEKVCELVSAATGVAVNDVLPSSTGVIGMPLSIEPFEEGIPQLAAQLAEGAEASTAATEAIMTTDTTVKQYAVEFEIDGKTCKLGAIGKGSGMIAPNMATMLEYYTTDVAITPAMLQKALSDAVPGTFNQMSVDRDTSTNDTLLILANGAAGNTLIEAPGKDYDAFYEAFYSVCEHMAREHASDGEGASHLIECVVTHADTLQNARAISKSVVCSDLFKSAVFGQDANWGRILCAVGYTPGDFDVSKVSVRLASKAGEVWVCENCAYHEFSEEAAAEVLKEKEIKVLVDMGSGEETAKAWGCDLTYDYVKINGDYRT